MCGTHCHWYRLYLNASACMCVYFERQSFVIQTAIWSPKGPSQSHSNSSHLLPGNCISNELRVLVLLEMLSLREEIHISKDREGQLTDKWCLQPHLFLHNKLGVGLWALTFTQPFSSSSPHIYPSITLSPQLEMTNDC